MLQVKLPENLTTYNYDEIVSRDHINPDGEYKTPVPIFNIGNVFILTKGNISMIQGRAKSRKTFFLLLLNYLILNSKQDVNKIAIYDTEQFKFHSAMFMRRLRSMTSRYNHVDFFNLRRYSKDVRFQFIQDHLQETKPDIVFIDNIRDIIRNYNDLEQSDDIITSLTQISENTGTHICCSLHVNPSDGKARGHIGTELQQKCETVFNVSTENDITTVEGVFTRNRPFEPFVFNIDENGLPRLMTIQEADNNITPF